MSGGDRRDADHRYSISEGGRARRRKADARYAAKRRARKYGVTPADIEKLIDEQGGVCPLTGEPVTSRSVVDHAYDVDLEPRDALRGVIDLQVNAILPNTDAGLAAFALAVMKYSGKRQRLHRHIECSSTPTRGHEPQRG